MFKKLSLASLVSTVVQSVELSEAFMQPYWSDVSTYSDASAMDVLSGYDYQKQMWYQSSEPQILDLSLAGSNEMEVQWTTSTYSDETSYLTLQMKVTQFDTDDFDADWSIRAGIEWEGTDYDSVICNFATMAVDDITVTVQDGYDSSSMFNNLDSSADETQDWSVLTWGYSLTDDQSQVDMFCIVQRQIEVVDDSGEDVMLNQNGSFSMKGGWATYDGTTRKTFKNANFDLDISEVIYDDSIISDEDKEMVEGDMTMTTIADLQELQLRDIDEEIQELEDEVTELQEELDDASGATQTLLSIGTVLASSFFLIQ